MFVVLSCFLSREELVHKHTYALQKISLAGLFNIVSHIYVKSKSSSQSMLNYNTLELANEELGTIRNEYVI